MTCCKSSRSRGNMAWFIAPLAFCGNIASAAQTLYISKTAGYANIEKVREVVRVECTPETQLPLEIREQILQRTSIQEVVPTDEPSAFKNALAIRFLILSLNVPPSAGWTTEKRSMRVKSIVYRNGVMAAEYVSYATAQGGGRLFNRTTCQIVDHLIRDIGVYTAEWLKTKIFQETRHPVPGSEEVKQ